MLSKVLILWLNNLMIFINYISKIYVIDLSSNVINILVVDKFKVLILAAILKYYM